MFTIQVDGTIQQIIKLFYLSGVWHSDEESHSRRLVKKLFYAFFGSLFPTFFAINSSLCADRSEFFLSAQATIVATVVYMKLLCLLVKKRELLAFLNDPTVLHSIKDREEYEQTKKKIEKFMRLVRLYCLAIFVTALLLILVKLPLFSGDKGLPLFISLSWNDSEIVYWLAYLFVSLSIFLYVISIFMAPLIWYMMLNYSIEYELLGNKLRNLGVAKPTIRKRDKNQKSFILTNKRIVYSEHLIALIKAHRNLNETVERFRSCFSTLFLGQIATGGIVICVSVYNLAFSSGKNVIETEMYIVTLLDGIFDIFLVLYLANDITVASDRLSYRLFESDWIEQPEPCRKNILIMGEVLKQPQQLVILIYQMNLRTFMTINNAAYRLFHIIKSFQRNDN